MATDTTNFVDQMKLEKIDDDTYRSTTLAPGFETRAYGGHFMAQALLAASRTVRNGFVVHNFTGYFLVEGRTDIHFLYRVRNLREGRGYCTRNVEVYQGRPEKLMYTCICSFKQPEPRGLDVQQQVDLREKYGVALRSKRPDEWPEAPAIDSPWFWKYMTRPGNSPEGDSNIPFPGVSRRKVDMRPYNSTVEPSDRVQLQYYRIRGPMPPVAEDPNMHVAAHLYSSDSNGLFIIPNFLQEHDADNYYRLGSLHHSVVFHVSPEELSWYDEDGNARWFVQEAWVGRYAYGRALAPSKYFREDGLHVLSTFQDGMVRLGSVPGGRPGLFQSKGDEKPKM
ncbi:Thioesterase/thiol ester dehydrase-isomerase [Rhizodiscina lignyota]|uniref:Thioesterase/thiol ester dehydrase-isomerase n=1 Tax=Rhizodiscina lignyota TaxID=1504668 RepID=A0A9P4IQH0_9PEZI|nr:Thioesterase/thiol ester dehydrase-isomerase [Rhizodiscina lignyota]